MTRNVEVMSSAGSEPAADGSAGGCSLVGLVSDRVRRIRRRRGVTMFGNRRRGVIVVRRRRILARIAVTRADKRDRRPR